MRRHRRRKSKQGKIIIITSICLLLVMTVGYAAFSTHLNISAKGNIDPRNNLYVSSTGNDETGIGTKNKPYQTISKAYDSAASEATIYVMDNLTIDETVTFDQDKKITLTSEANEINSLLRGEEDEMLIHITSGETTLANITLDGQNKEANWALLRINDSIVNLNSGTIVQNNIDNLDHGGGISAARATVTINGAKIINNEARAASGGGIITNYSTLTINSGEISGNLSTAASGGAIFFGGNNDLLTMNGGIIKNNSSPTMGGAIYLASTKMIMNGGEISDNTATYGGGICLRNFPYNPTIGSTFTFKNGEIKNNTATYGGGIYVDNIGTYIYEGGVISDNTPDDVYEV